MSNKTQTNEITDDNKQGTLSEEQWNELIHVVCRDGVTALKTHYEQVTGRAVIQETYGPVFIFSVKDDSNDEYECGFLLQELIKRFQSDEDPSRWMASFFVELMRTKGGKALPKPPASEEEYKAMLDHQIIPHCIATIEEEFAPEQVHAGLEWHEEHGPVFEAGFSSIVDGNNVCAFKIDLLLIHFLLNRDPAELALHGLYKIREEHGME
ncbi:hypothetical protein [Paenibacillus agilis]|uniref:Uncharacterized protein n=1 Tax=Paenibacillus agilis TaxID=3020863 RepID=A0A559IXJ4_9BACL|nr:hypothetical protein [Paenibacillus agilis]TVX92355.1 hypothetical protein FPZ44_04335 [Paenibacillus agilis]